MLQFGFETAQPYGNYSGDKDGKEVLWQHAMGFHAG